MGLVLAIAVIVSSISISRSLEISIGDEIEKLGPNIVVTPAAQSISIPYASVIVGNVTFPESAMDKIYTIPNKRNIRVLSPKLYGQVQYENNSLLVVGINASAEIGLKNWWKVNGAFPGNASNEALLGATVNSTLGLNLGSSIQFKDTLLNVVGVLEATGSVDDYSVFLPLRVAQTLLDLPGEVSIIDVGALCKDCPVEVIAQQITDAVPNVKATPVKQAVETRMKAVEQTASFSLMLASIILVVGCGGVMNTMLASVHERTREIGVFMSLGADSRYFYKMFILESLILGVAGGLAGAAVGVTSSLLLAPLFTGAAIDFAAIPLYLIPLAAFLAVSACVVASIYPTWRASKTDPVKALKAI